MLSKEKGQELHRRLLTLDLAQTREFLDATPDIEFPDLENAIYELAGDQTIPYAENADLIEKARTIFELLLRDPRVKSRIVNSRDIMTAASRNGVLASTLIDLKDKKISYALIHECLGGGLIQGGTIAYIFSRNPRLSHYDPHKLAEEFWSLYGGVYDPDGRYNNSGSWGRDHVKDAARLIKKGSPLDIVLSDYLGIGDEKQKLLFEQTEKLAWRAGYAVSGMLYILSTYRGKHIPDINSHEEWEVFNTVRNLANIVERKLRVETTFIDRDMQWKYDFPDPTESMIKATKIDDLSWRESAAQRLAASNIEYNDDFRFEIMNTLDNLKAEDRDSDISASIDDTFKQIARTIILPELARRFMAAPVLIHGINTDDLTAPSLETFERVTARWLMQDQSPFKAIEFAQRWHGRQDHHALAQAQKMQPVQYTWPVLTTGSYFFEDEGVTIRELQNVAELNAHHEATGHCVNGMVRDILNPNKMVRLFELSQRNPRTGENEIIGTASIEFVWDEKNRIWNIQNHQAPKANATDEFVPGAFPAAHRQPDSPPHVVAAFEKFKKKIEIVSDDAPVAEMDEKLAVLFGGRPKNGAIRVNPDALKRTTVEMISRNTETAFRVMVGYDFESEAAWEAARNSISAQFLPKRFRKMSRDELMAAEILPGISFNGLFEEIYGLPPVGPKADPDLYATFGVNKD